MIADLHNTTGQSARPAHNSWFLALIAAVVLIAFLPLFTAEFTAWDDGLNIVQNPRLNPPTSESIRFYWTNAAHDLYVPLTYTVWAGLARLGWTDVPSQSGSHLNPYVFHGANVLLHACSAALVFSILARLKFSAAASLVAALVFALHPVQVESVGWVSGLKDVLSGMLALASIRCGIESGRARFATAPLMLLAMLAKPGAMVVPAILLAIDIGWRLRTRRAAWVRCATLLPLAVACAVWTRLAQPASFVDVPTWQRPLIACDAIAFYVYKLVCPLWLGIDYGRSPEALMQSWQVWMTWLVPVVIAAVLWRFGGRIRPIVAGAAIFVIAVSPVLGLVPFDFQIYSTVADHYLYLPMLGIAICCAWLCSKHRVARAVLIVVLVVLAGRTVAQTMVWRDSVSLFENALRVNPASWASHNNLATALIEQQRFDEAAAHCVEATQLNPRYAMALDNLGHVQLELGKPIEAEASYRRASELEPTDVRAWTGLGHAQSAQHRLADATTAYRRAVELAPRSAMTLTNLASVLAEQGKLDEAISLYRRALEVNPNDANARAGLSRAMNQTAAPER